MQKQLYRIERSDMMGQTGQETVIELTDTIEETSEDEVIIQFYRDSFSGKKKCDKQELTKEIKRIFESCNVNLLIGSGYCSEKLKTLSNLESLIEENALTNIKNVSKKNAIEALILYVFFKNSIYPHKDDIKAFCSFESSNRFILKLADLLSNRNDKNLLKRVNIFTTNYDMYFELSLETNKIYYNDGFSGRLVPSFSTQNYNRIVKQIVQNTERESELLTINLYKLHGSLTWSKKSDQDQIVYISNPEELLQSIEDQSIVFTDENFMYDKTSESNIKDTIKTINDSHTEFSDELLEGIDEFNKLYQKLHIINPTKKKFEETLFSNVYYDLLRMYSNELEKNHSVLFVFGFSFKDEHIYSITKRALSNPSMIMYIFVHDSNDIVCFKNMFKEHYNVFYIYYENKKIDLNEFSNIMFGG
jgi:hypothetical protein